MGNEGRRLSNQERRTSQSKGIFPPADHIHHDLVDRLTDIESGDGNVTVVDANYTLLPTDKIVTCKGTFTITLYPAVQNDGFDIVNIGTGEITLGGEDVNDITNMILSPNSSVTIFGTATPDWRIR